MKTIKIYFSQNTLFYKKQFFNYQTCFLFYFFVMKKKIQKQLPNKPLKSRWNELKI